MKKINFENLPSTNTPINSTNLNQVQDNVEKVFNGEESMGSIVVEDIECKNLFNKNTITIDRGISTATGDLYGQTGLFTTDYINVANLSDIAWNGEYTSANKPWGAFYDSDKKYISGFETTLNVNTKVIPEGVTYVRLTYVNNSTDFLDKLQIEKGSIATEYTPYKKFGYNSTDSMGEIVVDDIKCKNLLYTPYNKNNKLTLTANHNDYYELLDFRCYLEAGTTYTFSCETSATTFGGSASQVQVMLFLNKEATTVINMGQKCYTFVPTVSGLYYLRCDVNVSGDTQSFWNFQIEQGPDATNYVEHKEFENNEIYLENEQVIGTWINGKPIYRKVFKNRSVPNTAFPFSFSSDWEYIVRTDFKYFANNSTKDEIHEAYYNSSDDFIRTFRRGSSLEIRCGSSLVTDVARMDFIFEYTKTTD